MDKIQKRVMTFQKFSWILCNWKRTIFEKLNTKM